MQKLLPLFRASYHEVHTNVVIYKGEGNYEFDGESFESPPSLIEKPYWKCFLKEPLEGSTNKSYEEQEAMVAQIALDENGLPLYELPESRDLFIYLFIR